MRTHVLSSCLLLAVAACSPGEAARAPSRPVPLVPGTPRDAYALRAAAGHDEATIRAWEDASRRALRSGLGIPPAFRERVRFPAHEPHAVAWRFGLAAGQTIRVDITPLDGATPLFADVFEVVSDDIYRHVRTAQPGEDAFTFAPTAPATYVLRLQPRIGAGGTFDIAVRGDSPLLFPVAGFGPSAIGGRYGDPRDGGVRAHEGVDIFAPRGTSALAVADGIVTSVGRTSVGGNVVWLEDPVRGLSYYYAHLDAFRVRRGQRVRAGDIVGTVGSTGNASGGRPHLHFGVYRYGRTALDPAPFLHQPLLATDLTRPVDAPSLGRRTLSPSERVRLRRSPHPDGTVLAVLPAETPLLVIGAVGEWRRVVLDDGATGFLPARAADTAPADERQRTGGR